MNINNIEKAVKIKERITQNSLNLKTVLRWLDSYPNGSSDGSGHSSDGKIYNLHVSEWRDGSGLKLDLTGSLVQSEILKNIAGLLEDQIQKDLAEIESL